MGKQAMVMRQGEGEYMSVLGTRLRFLCGSEKTEKQWSMMEVVLPKHAGPPPHHHPWDEAYYVIEGEVRFALGERTELVKGGEFIYAPGGTLHGFQGVSEQPARMLILDAPAHAEAFFRAVDHEVKELPRDMAKVPEIGDRHQIHFVRPKQ